MYLLDCLERQVESLDSHPEIGVLGTGLECIDDLGKSISSCFYPGEPGVIKFPCFFAAP